VLIKSGNMWFSELEKETVDPIIGAAQTLATLIREEIEGNSKTVPCEPNEESVDRLFLWNIGHYGGSAYDTYKAAIQAAPSILQELIEGE
jgi:hypothetical protein